MNSNRVGGTPGGAAALDGTAPARSFYCIADRSFYLGAVALINSLRLVGHSERIVVLDCGLADSQRALLSREATIVDPESRGPLEPEILPILLRARAPLALPAKAMILLDADIIVVRELEPLFQEAESGKIVAFTDALDRRFSDRWQAELGTESMRQQSYVNTGLLGLPF